MTDLARPLYREQIAAANALYSRSKLWRLIDLTLADLHESMPGFGPKATLAKTCAINSLYSTNVYDVQGVAAHVTRLLARRRAKSIGPELVERIGNVPLSNGKERHLRSFASKFASIFIDAARFPILDSLATESLLWHLESMPRPRRLAPTYLEFIALVQELEGRGNLADIHRRDLDRYLWLSAHYRSWRRRKDAPINAEAKRLFEEDAGRIAPLGPVVCGSD